jgi:hypothetical protein
MVIVEVVVAAVRGKELRFPVTLSVNDGNRMSDPLTQAHGFFSSDRCNDVNGKQMFSFLDCHHN